MENRCEGFDVALVPYLPALRRRAQTLTKSRPDAADLFQDTVERALRGWSRFRPDTNIAAWLMTIMHRRAIDISRKKRLWRRAVSAELYDLPAPPAYSPVPWENIGPGQLRRAMSRLPERLRITLTLRVFDRLPCRDIAQRQVIPLCTVHTRLRRARLKLRMLLQQPQPLREPPPSGSTVAMRRRAIARTGTGIGAPPARVPMPATANATATNDAAQA